MAFERFEGLTFQVRNGPGGCLALRGDHAGARVGSVIQLRRLRGTILPMADARADEEPVPLDDDLRTLAKSLSRVFSAVHLLASREDRPNEFADRITAHVGVESKGLPVVSQELPPYQLIDVQVALGAWTDVKPGRSLELVGVSGDQRRFHPLSELLSGEAGGIGIGAVDYVDLADSPDSTRSCVQFGLFLLTDGSHKAAALLRGPDPHGPMQASMIEIISREAAHGIELMGELRKLAVERSVLRGQILALGVGEGNQYGGFRFMHRPTLTRDELVLPEDTIVRIERHVMGIAAHRTRLQDAGQHLKRGVLLYGPPGTGKTHTVRYLLSRLEGVTAFILSGQSLALVGSACAMARLFQPSLVILEDVDLVAADRSFGPVGANGLLFEVLNQIDGLGDDVDVTFLLTTNRVDILERALSERPGRVDAAVEIDCPDRTGRSRLLRLYGMKLGVDELTAEELSDAIEITEGRTATYLREVVRRAALAAAEDHAAGPLRVDGAMLARAAEQLMEDRAILTQSLLEGPDEPDAEPPMVGWVGSSRMRGMPRRVFPYGMTSSHLMQRGGGDEEPPVFAPE